MNYLEYHANFVYASQKCLLGEADRAHLGRDQVTKRQNSKGRVVYSTDPSAQSVCPQCRADPCQCPQAQGNPAATHSPRVQREKGGRGGKMVTIVYDLEIGTDELRELAGQLKRLCATGGTVKDGTIVIQGDHAQRIVAELKTQGYRARRSGG